MRVIRLPGLTDYQETWDFQNRIHQEVCDGEEDTLIVTEHSPVVTIGRSGGDDHLLVSQERLREAGVQLVYTNRGGDITYHGPGQLVIYPVIDLKRHYQDVHRYLRDLEEAAIRLLARYGALGFRIEGRTGVWTERGKVAAIGVHIRKWVTLHGMSFNVRANLPGFGYIVPCGIGDAPVTSLDTLVGRTTDWGEVEKGMIEEVETVFGGNGQRA